MKVITFDKIHEADRQEELPDYSDDYPCITTRAELARYPQQYMPWHWHQPVELFYIKSGELEYNTPAGKICFPAGSGGLLNSGVIHMTRPHLEKGTPIQLLHIFDPYFLVDSRDGLLARRYIKPFVDSSTELVLFSPEIPNHKKLLDAFIASFKLDENAPEAEMVLRNILAEIWVKLISLLPEVNSTFGDPFISSRLRMMLEFIHTHYAERITVREIASAGTSSKRFGCYKLLILSAWAWLTKNILVLFSHTPTVIYAAELLQFCSYGIYIPSIVQFIASIYDMDSNIRGQSLVSFHSSVQG